MPAMLSEQLSVCWSSPDLTVLRSCLTSMSRLGCHEGVIYHGPGGQTKIEETFSVGIRAVHLIDHDDVCRGSALFDSQSKLIRYGTCTVVQGQRSNEAVLRNPQVSSRGAFASEKDCGRQAGEFV